MKTLEQKYIEALEQIIELQKQIVILQKPATDGITITTPGYTLQTPWTNYVPTFHCPSSCTTSHVEKKNE